MSTKQNKHKTQSCLVIPQEKHRYVKSSKEGAGKCYFQRNKNDRNQRTTQLPLKCWEKIIASLKLYTQCGRQKKKKKGTPQKKYHQIPGTYKCYLIWEKVLRWWGPKPKCPHCETQIRRKWCNQENRSWDKVCTKQSTLQKFQEARKDSPLQLPQGVRPCHTWILASDSHNCERINFYGFKATILVAICHSSHRKPVHSLKRGSNESKIKTFSQRKFPASRHAVRVGEEG